MMLSSPSSSIFTAHDAAPVSFNNNFSLPKLLLIAREKTSHDKITKKEFNTVYLLKLRKSSQICSVSLASPWQKLNKVGFWVSNENFHASSIFLPKFLHQLFVKNTQLKGERREICKFMTQIGELEAHTWGAKLVTSVEKDSFCSRKIHLGEMCADRKGWNKTHTRRRKGKKILRRWRRDMYKWYQFNWLGKIKT